MGWDCSAYGGGGMRVQCFGTGENLRERDHWRDPDIVGIFRKWDVEVGTGSSWRGIGTVGGHL